MSNNVEKLRSRFKAASDKRRVAEAAWEGARKPFTGPLWLAMRKASRNEMDAYLKYFDARQAA